MWERTVMPSPHLPHGNPLCGLTQLKFFFRLNPAPSQTLTLWKGLPICSHPITSYAQKPHGFAESQHHIMFLCSLSFTWQLITSCCAPSLMLLICRMLHALYYYVTPHVLSHQPELSSGGVGGVGRVTYLSLNSPKLLAEWLTQEMLNKCVTIDGFVVDFSPAHALCCCQKNLSQGLCSLHNSSRSFSSVCQHY